MHGLLQTGPEPEADGRMDVTSDATIDEVVDFWRQAGVECWFGGGEAFDRECRERFGAAHFAAARRERDDWNRSANGALALQILLDQIPRNIFRGSAHSFATDPLALCLARQALDAGLDGQVEEDLRLFVYLAFEHSEDMADQHIAVEHIEPLGNAEYTHYAIAHRDVIARFGRFPHRNKVLARKNTPQEQAYLDGGGGF